MSRNQEGVLLSPIEQTKSTLMDLGFKNLDAFFKHCPEVKTVEDALERLEWTPLGYRHPFIVDPIESLQVCLICREREIFHYDKSLERGAYEDI